MVFQCCAVFLAVLAFELIALIDFVPQEKRIAGFKTALSQIPGPRLAAQETTRKIRTVNLEMKDLVSTFILKSDLADIAGFAAGHRSVVALNRNFYRFTCFLSLGE